MTIYSLYIFDRHCACIYYQDWHRTKRPKAARDGNILPFVSRSILSSQPPESQSTFVSPRNTLASDLGVVIAVNDMSTTRSTTPVPPTTQPSGSGLPFDEEAKLVYGVILSLRNMVKKLSRSGDDMFINYRTSSYKLHLFETLSGYKFIILTDSSADSLRFVLRQIYSGPFLEFVVRNPLVEMDSKERGIDNEAFRAGVDRLVRGLSMFA